MPWYHGDYPPSYKNQPVEIREKAVEIANELLLHGSPEGVAIATGLKRARQHFGKEETESSEESVQRGQAAIEAEEKANPKPEQDRQKDRQQDADQWRNEG